MSTLCNLAIVGASGAVGRQILEVLAEREFPVGELRLLASERSEGDFLDFGGEAVLVRRLEQDSFAGVDIAFFAAGHERSEQFCPLAAASGALSIDLSGFWNLHPDVPLVVPEVNPGEVARCRQLGIVASPSAPSTQLALALKPLQDTVGIRRLVVSTYQAVSDGGQRGVDELRIQCGELLNGRPCTARVFPQQVAFNCLPQVGPLEENGESWAERLLAGETRRIFGTPSLGVCATAVQVPVFYGHCAAVNIETAEKLSVARARDLLAAARGIRFIDPAGQEDYPMPVDAAGLDEVLVGRLREDPSIANGLNLWVVADNLRKGAATNAVQIAEILAERGL